MSTVRLTTVVEISVAGSDTRHASSLGLLFVTTALQDRKAGVLGKGRIGRRALAQVEGRATVGLDQALKAAVPAQPDTTLLQSVVFVAHLYRIPSRSPPALATPMSPGWRAVPVRCQQILCYKPEEKFIDSRPCFAPIPLESS
jgi:hypothetical protein